MEQKNKMNFWGKLRSVYLPYAALYAGGAILFVGMIKNEMDMVQNGSILVALGYGPIVSNELYQQKAANENYAEKVSDLEKKVSDLEKRLEQNKL